MIHSLNRREAPAELGRTGHRKGNLPPVGGADPHLLQGMELPPLIFRVTDHDPHFVPPPLDALSFFAVKGLSDLASQVRQSEASGLRLRSDPDFELLFSRFEGVGEVEDPGIGAQTLLQLFRGGLQGFEIRPGQLDVDGLTGGKE